MSYIFPKLLSQCKISGSVKLILCEKWQIAPINKLRKVLSTEQVWGWWYKLQVEVIQMAKWLVLYIIIIINVVVRSKEDFVWV